MASQQIDHHAGMGRIEMLDQDESHPAIGGQRVEELAERVEAAGRRTERDDRKTTPRC
jgi:hypothetical protein